MAALNFDMGKMELLNEIENVTLSQLLDIHTQQLVEQEVNKQFAIPVTSGDLKVQQDQRIPKKTCKGNHWALGVWTEWVKYINSRQETFFDFNGESIPEDICELSNKDLNFWMQRFIVEIRRKEGTNYPPNTLTQIVAGLQRHLRNRCSERQFNFCKDSVLDFAEFRKTLDGRMKYLTSQGIGIQKKRCDPVTEADEIKMWETGVFSDSTASGLSNAIFFYNRKTFGF